MDKHNANDTPSNILARIEGLSVSELQAEIITLQTALNKASSKICSQREEIIEAKRTIRGLSTEFRRTITEAGLNAYFLQQEIDELKQGGQPHK